MTLPTLGLDLGALTVKAVLIADNGQMRRSLYRLHRGQVVPALRQALVDLGLAEEAELRLVLTGACAALCPAHPAVLALDRVQAMIAAVRRLWPQARNIVDIGGASLTLVRLDEAQRFRDFASNSQCAAGTGSFLDEQAARLNLDYAAMAQLEPVVAPPAVATRCAVFAKSDLIHLQQAGASKPQMWSGLCRGMAQTAWQTLLKGKPLRGPTVLLGGVAQNGEVVRWLRALSDVPLLTDANTAHLATALGAAWWSQEHPPTSHAAAGVAWRAWLERAGEEGAEGKAACGAAPRAVAAAAHAVGVGALAAQEPPACECGCVPAAPPQRSLAAGTLFGGARAAAPLQLKKTRYPSFAVEEAWVDERGNEVRLSGWPRGGHVAASLGIDIGSTSTKLCLIDAGGAVLADIYRKTAGDPLKATQHLFDALRQAAAQKETHLAITACGTTGSGRKMVAAVVGADAVVNEISAHVAGATHHDAGVETIFEIGGQDAKYMRVRRGAIVDANMNYVCAAGTGSFIEEQARKLNVPLTEVGALVLGRVPPPTSDRCTVFMEQDVNKLLRAGATPADVLAGVLRSVVQNYLNKVVGKRPYSTQKIVFQGATARNQGLVAAFETLLGVEMVVSPYCHVMGAWGVALLAQQKVRQGQAASRFFGLDLSGRHITLRRDTCELCQNVCEITHAAIEGVDHEPSWGYQCGREPHETKMRALREYSVMHKRARALGRVTPLPPPAAVSSALAPRPRVVVPRALGLVGQMPLWTHFLQALGAQVEVGGPTTRAVREQGAALCGADFCFPVKVAHGHIAAGLAQGGADYLFVPYLVAQPPAPPQSNTFFCPYVQGLAAVASSALELAGLEATRLLSPVVDRRLTLERQVAALHAAVGEALHVTRQQVEAAFQGGLAAQERFEAEGESAFLAALKALKGAGIVVIGRPYNVYDTGVNLDLPRKIAEMGYPVFPVDMLPFSSENIDPQYHNVCWTYGQKILSAVQRVRREENLFAVYLTNFNCGPDSFLLSYAEAIMGDKPMLVLELDEHGADAGYLTRLEAFLDVVRAWHGARGTAPAASVAPAAATEAEGAEPAAGRAPAGAAKNHLRDSRIWIPAMHPFGAELFAAAFRGDGFDAAALPPETRSDFELGQKLARGCECLPMRVTLGSFVRAVEQAPQGRHVLFMPTAKGPCRFGQYATLNRLILDRMGQAQVQLLSPSSDNAYAGLSEALRRRLWRAMLAADMLTKMVLRVRPYEQQRGDANAAAAHFLQEAIHVLAAGGDVLPVVAAAGKAFARIPRHAQARPLVGIVGEIFVRNNVFSNEDLIGAVERAGGEAWLVPISEWILYTAAEDVRKFKDFRKNVRQTWVHLLRLLKSKYLERDERRFYRAAGALLAERHEPPVHQTLAMGRTYLPFNIGGEALLSLGRSVLFARQGAAMVINASPFGCMAGTVSAALLARVASDVQMPIVNLFYEAAGDENSRLPVYLANLEQARPPQAAAAKRRLAAA